MSGKHETCAEDTYKLIEPLVRFYEMYVDSLTKEYKSGEISEKMYLNRRAKLFDATVNAVHPHRLQRYLQFKRLKRINLEIESKYDIHTLRFLEHKVF